VTSIILRKIVGEGEQRGKEIKPGEKGHFIKEIIVKNLS